MNGILKMFKEVKSTDRKERSRLCTPSSSDPNLTDNLVLRKDKFVERY